MLDGPGQGMIYSYALEYIILNIRHSRSGFGPSAQNADDSPRSLDLPSISMKEFT